LDLPGNHAPVNMSKCHPNLKEDFMRNIFFVLAAIMSSISITANVLAADCTPTVSMTGGTHYKPVTTKNTDVGKGLLVSGRILSSVDCEPIADAKIAHWQAGENGQYQDRLRAYLFSDANGHYRFRTEWPAATIPHIHFITSAEGFKSVGTQWIGGDRVKEINFDIVLRPDPAN